MTFDLYQAVIAEASALKIRAKSLLAEGGEQQTWEAAVLFHEAARQEARALKALDKPSPQLRLRSAVERCGCLLDGMDLLGAAQVRGEILELKADLSAEEGAAILARIDKKFTSEVHRFQNALQQAPTFEAARASANLVPGASRPRAKLRQELRALLQQFPGTPFFWWSLYRNCEADADLEAAWAALERAARLDPDSSTYAAIKLWLGPQVLDRAATTSLLARAYWSLRDASAEVCLQYALAEHRLLKRPFDPERIKRIRRAINDGESRPGVPERLRSYLRALAFALDETVEGRTPTLDVLYRAGLGDLAVSMALAAHADPVQMIASAAKRAAQRD